MLGRTYPTYMGLGEFIVGFGQRRQQVKAQEAQQQMAMQAQQGQAIAQGIGQGAQGLAQGISQAALIPYQADQRMALLNQQGALQRANDYRDAYYSQYGTLPPTDAGAFPDTGSPALGASMDASGALGPPSVGVQQPPPPMAGVPAPISNPALTAEYQKKRAELDQMTMARDAFMADPSRPADEKVAFASAMNPRIQATQSLLQRYPTPKPPVTFEEMAAAGVHGGGITVTPDGSWLVPKGITRAMPPKTYPDAVPIPQTAQEAQQYVQAREAVLTDGTKVLIQPDGKLTPVKDGGADGGTDLPKFDYGKYEKQSITETAEGVVTKPKPGQVVENYLQDVRATKMADEALKYGLEEAQRRDKRRHQLETWIRELKDLYPQGPQSMPSQRQQTLAEWVAEYKSVGGS